MSSETKWYEEWLLRHTGLYTVRELERREIEIDWYIIDTKQYYTYMYLSLKDLIFVRTNWRVHGALIYKFGFFGGGFFISFTIKLGYMAKKIDILIHLSFQ